MSSPTVSINEAEAAADLSSDSPFYKIVLTGGPCGGKTTALARVSSYLRERGFEVFTCPEAFTILSSNGFSLDYFTTEGMDIVAQTTVLNWQRSMEDGMESILKARCLPAVLLCDRGLQDGAAYMSREKWTLVLNNRGLQVTDARDARYNAVFHMVTAAEGAEAFYTLDNNDVRSETPEAAREMDERTQRAWVGHPKMYVLDNSTDFEGKLQRLVEFVAKLVGLPTNLSRRTAKFLLRDRPNPGPKFPLDVDYHLFEVEKVYLVTQPTSPQFREEYIFIRRRTSIAKDGKHTGSVYGMTTVQITRDGHTVEKKRIITRREYTSSLGQRDLTRHIIRQQRISFLYKLQSFNIHVSVSINDWWSCLRL
jgi:predicted ATPase